MRITFHAALIHTTMKSENFSVLTANTIFPWNQSRCGEMKQHQWTDTIPLQLINFYKGHRTERYHFYCNYILCQKKSRFAVILHFKTLF
jgi:hypothetical protein